MKNIFLSLLFSVCLPALAIDLPKFESKYLFDSALLNVQQMQHHITLVVLAEDARQALIEYKETGYTCRYFSNNMHQCKKFIHEITEDKELRNRIAETNSAIILNFEASAEDYSLVNDAISLKEFDKKQNSSFSVGLFDKIHFYITPDLKKFKIYDSKNAGVPEHFYLTQSGRIARQISATNINKKSASYIIEDKNVYLYEGIWKQ